MWSLLFVRTVNGLVPLRSAILGAAIAAAAASATAAAPPVLSAPPQLFSESCSDAPAHFAAFMAFLRVKLAIDDDQDPAWQAFLREAREGVMAEEAVCRSHEDPLDELDAQSAVVKLLVEREVSALASLQSARRFRLALQGLLPVLHDEQKDRLPYLLFGPQGPMRFGDQCLPTR